MKKSSKGLTLFAIKKRMTASGNQWWDKSTWDQLGMKTVTKAYPDLIHHWYWFATYGCGVTVIPNPFRKGVVGETALIGVADRTTHGYTIWQYDVITNNMLTIGAVAEFKSLPKVRKLLRSLAKDEYTSPIGHVCVGAYHGPEKESESHYEY